MIFGKVRRTHDEYTREYYCRWGPYTFLRGRFSLVVSCYDGEQELFPQHSNIGNGKNKDEDRYRGLLSAEHGFDILLERQPRSLNILGVYEP